MKSCDQEQRSKILQVVEQGETTLPFLTDRVPVLYVADGSPYIPVVTICKALGIDAHYHIQRWRTLLLWETAEKLPYQTARGKRLVHRGRNGSTIRKALCTST